MSKDPMKTGIAFTTKHKVAKTALRQISNKKTCAKESARQNK